VGYLVEIKEIIMRSEL